MSDKPNDEWNCLLPFWIDNSPEEPMPSEPLSELREQLGKRVREVWIAWAREQPSPKASWLVPWEELDEPSKEVDRRIGMALRGDFIAEHTEALATFALMESVIRALAAVSEMNSEDAIAEFLPLRQLAIDMLTNESGRRCLTP